MTRHVLSKRAAQQVAQRKLLERGAAPAARPTPNTPQETVSRVMAFLRAMAIGKRIRFRELAAACEHLSAYAQAASPERVYREHLSHIKSTVVEHYKQEALLVTQQLHPSFLTKPRHRQRRHGGTLPGSSVNCARGPRTYWRR